MQTMPRFRAIAPFIVVAALAFAIGSSPARATETYPIKLVRVPKVGQKYTITADGALTRHTTFTAGGKDVATDDEYGIHLEGTVEVLAVNKDGEEGKVACTVTKC